MIGAGTYHGPACIHCGLPAEYDGALWYCRMLMATPAAVRISQRQPLPERMQRKLLTKAGRAASHVECTQYNLRRGKFA